MALIEPLAIETDGLLLEAASVPWDTAIFGFPVGQIHQIQARSPAASRRDAAGFLAWRDTDQFGLISCRLAHDRLNESMLLEDLGFRFVEMVLHPVIGLTQLDVPDQGLRIEAAAACDLEEIQAIAASAFVNERFHIDPRLDSRRADARYARWAASAITHPRQRLLKFLDGNELVAFFVVETLTDMSVYWHLTAVAPRHHGKGYGRRVWLSMIRRHQQDGCVAASTTIAARNVPVLNLYASLNFRFKPPEMTFHWVRG